jgi:hypothetical protein
MDRSTSFMPSGSAGVSAVFGLAEMDSESVQEIISLITIDISKLTGSIFVVSY